MFFNWFKKKFIKKNDVFVETEDENMAEMVSHVYKTGKQAFGSVNKEGKLEIKED